MKIRRCTSALAFMGAAFCLAQSHAEAQSSYPWFARASNLEADHVWVVDEFSEGELRMDFKVMRWTGSSWSTCKEGADCSKNEGRLSWGQPVYSPADGVITSCFRNFPDNPAPGQKLDAVDESGSEDDEDATIFGGGNNVWIMTDEGDMIALTHMQKGSIPSSLCPHDAEEIEDLSDKTGSYRTEMWVPPVQRARVQRGQLIGLVGNSGNSTAPHMHIQFNAIDGVDDVGEGRPIRLKQVYAQDFRADQGPVWNGWYPRRGEEFTASDDGFTMIHPAPFLRRADATIGSMSEVDTVFVDDSLAVTAIRNGQGRLQLTSWDAAVSDVDRLSDYVGSSASQVKVAKVGDNLILAGYRSTGGLLTMQLFRVNSAGVFSLLDTFTSQAITMLDLTGYGSGNRAVTAARNSDGNLWLAEWGVVSTDNGLQIMRRAVRTEGPVSALAITSARNFNGVAVAVKTGSQTLKTIPYRISNTGLTMFRGADQETNDTMLGAIDIIGIPQGFVAGVRDSLGRLKLVSYSASAQGDLIRTESSYLGGSISAIALDITQDAGSDVIASLRDGDGNLLVQSFAMEEDGDQIRRGGSAAAGAISRVASAATQRIAGGGAPRDMLLTAVRNGSGNLTLIYWDVNLSD